jgi:hypothetical protein
LELNKLASQSLFWHLGNFWIIYNNSSVVDFGTLCDDLYMIDLMPSLPQFSFRASFVNVVVVSKSSRNIENFPLCCGTDVWTIFLGQELKCRFMSLNKLNGSGTLNLMELFPLVVSRKMLLINVYI